MDPSQLLRDLAPQVLATLVRRYRDFSAAEDAVQEALVVAAAQWPEHGVPENPVAWLRRVASRRVVDQVRAEAARRHRESLVVSLVPLDEQIALSADHESQNEGRDDSLEMLFLCCHPSLTSASAIALTLRAVGGLSTAEIARAFLVPEATMAQRISRAKEQVRASGEPFVPLTPEEFHLRLKTVAHVLYLVFNEGYAASGGRDVVRTDLTAEAIRLTRWLARLVPNESEIAGLLALMLLTDARRDARTGPCGELIPLGEQNRSLWDASKIQEGVALLSNTLPRGAIGPYQLQAAIAAIHDEAESTQETDWGQIAALYRLLDQIEPSPLAQLNLAVATAMVEGPAVGLLQVDRIAKDPRLAGSHRVDAVRAHLYERMGEHEQASHFFRRAAEGTASEAERTYLLMCAARLGSDAE
jgi:RNA polymerase sigma factor (sigma-70 family)